MCSRRGWRRGTLQKAQGGNDRIHYDNRALTNKGRHVWGGTVRQSHRWPAGLAGAFVLQASCAHKDQTIPTPLAAHKLDIHPSAARLGCWT